MDVDRHCYSNETASRRRAGGLPPPAHVPFLVRRMGVTYNIPTPLESSFQGTSRYSTTSSYHQTMRDVIAPVIRAVQAF